MTTFTYDENSFSDIYKEVNGFRPHYHEFWKATPERKQQIWNYLLSELDRVNNDLEKIHIAALADFEHRIAECINYGAPDRETAIRWIIEGEEVGYEMSPHELVWHFNLPENMSTSFLFLMEVDK